MSEFYTKKESLKYLDPDKKLRLTMHGLNQAIREGHLVLIPYMGKAVISRHNMDRYKQQCHEQALAQSSDSGSSQMPNQLGTYIIEKTDNGIVNRRLQDATMQLKTTSQSGYGKGKRRVSRGRKPELVT